jgi:hypothetical protein
MSSSRSSNQSQANQTQQTTTSNLNLQETSGITLADIGGPVNLTTTDFDAVSMAGELGTQAIDLGRRSVDNVVDFAGRGVDSIVGATRDVNRDSLDFAGQALDTVADFADSGRRDSLDFATGALDKSFNFAGQSLEAATQFATDAGGSVLDFARDMVGNTVSGFKELTMQTSASTDDRVAKVALYAFAAVAASVVLPKLFAKAS